MLENLRNQFLNPSDEFTPIPFWFWNDILEETEISRQIHDFMEKGVMGFVIHPRIGIPKDIQYLSDRFMALVKHAVMEASRLGMKVVLYDEAMYPSGSAHGLVVKGNPEYATRGIRMQEYPCNGSCEIVPVLSDGETIISVQAVQKTSTTTLHPNSILQLEVQEGKIRFEAPQTGPWSVLLFIETFTNGTIRGIHFGEDDREPDAPPSGDLMNPAAMEKFIHLTYDRYYEVLKEYFGSTVMAMFTDEPDVMGRCAKPGIKAWTPGFLDWYKQHGGSECDLPFLWFDADKAATIRNTYKRAVNKRLEYAYYSKISHWCEDHGIALTGHPHESDEIGFLKHFHIPGQDLVWRWVAPENNKSIEGAHSTMAKCSSDAARHMGRRRNSNECFGCCGPEGIHWAFSADDMKWYLDWLFVRGVNLLYPHAFYYSIDGEGRYGERPPDVGPNNIWWKYYHHVSSYIKRMSWLMTDSVNAAQIAVLCEEDRLPWAIVKPFYLNQMEFNYIEDTMIVSDACEIAGGSISVQKQKYRVLVVEEANMLTAPLCKKLQNFIHDGGCVIVHNNSGHELLLQGTYEIACMDTIAEDIVKFADRDIYICPPHKDLRLSHVIKDNVHFFLLVNEGENAIEGNLHVASYGGIEIWDAWQGEFERPAEIYSEDQYLVLPVCIQRRESMILCLDPSKKPELRHCTNKMQGVHTEMELQNAWKISSNLLIEPITTKKLESWTQWDGMAEFSGTFIYETDFELEDLIQAKGLELDLGQVCEMVHLYVNGTDAGFKLWDPYSFDIAPYVKAGRNTIRAEVTNSLANKLSGAKLASGLLGPVKLRWV